MSLTKNFEARQRGNYGGTTTRQTVHGQPAQRSTFFALVALLALATLIALPSERAEGHSQVTPYLIETDRPSGAWWWSGAYTVLGGQTRKDEGCGIWCEIEIQTLKNGSSIHWAKSNAGSSVTIHHDGHPASDHHSRCRWSNNTGGGGTLKISCDVWR